MDGSKRFDGLYHQLAQAWEAHQALRRSEASLSDLSESVLRLHKARLAMLHWHIRQPGIR